MTKRCRDAAGLQLSRVVLLGRTFEEYTRFFGLNPEEWRGRRILDVAGGVSSFAAEAVEKGLEVTAVDPIYGLDQQEIARRSGEDLKEVAEAIGKASTYNWKFYRSPARMAQLRERARMLFLRDYAEYKGKRYLEGSLPDLPLPGSSFDLVLVSYFLFVYQAQLSYELHLASIRELLRVCRGEIRIYPTVTFEAEESIYLRRLKAEAEFSGRDWEIVATDFEFLRNSNNYLRIGPKPMGFKTPLV